MRARIALAYAACALAAVAGCAPVPPPAAVAPPTAAATATAAVEPTVAPAAALPTVGTVVKHGSRSSRLVALTFDLCATPGDREKLDAGVVRVLRARSAAATFMMGGLWADAHRTEAVLLAGEPDFEIGNHGEAHLHIRRLGDAAALAEIGTAEDTIERITGVHPQVFRYPYDEWDARADAQMSAFGLTGVSADVITGDPDPNVSADRMVSAVLSQARGGSIVLMHANGNGVHTAEALPAIIDGLRRRGFTLVTVSRLLASQ